MSVDQAFFEQGVRAAVEAMADAVGKAGLHLRPASLSRAAHRRCMKAFRQIAAIVRRLIFLMALQVELPPPRPRAPRTAAPQPGVEDVTASFGPQPRGLRLAPRISGVYPECFRGVSGVRPGGPVPAGPLLARWAALHRVLKDPEASARRLACTIERWRKAGEPAPQCWPLGFEPQLPRELSMVATVLPQLIRRGLAPWNDTG